MFHRIAEFSPVLDTTGRWYTPRAYASLGVNAEWQGFIVFFPSADGRVVSTPRETTQTTLEALSHWVSTLDDVYLEGALARALDASAGVELAAEESDLVLAESAAAANAIALRRAAERARLDADAESA